MNVLRAILFMLAACGGGGGDLDPDVVTSLPPGDATGSAMTGSYRMASLTTDCIGDCTTTIEGFLYSACDVGTRLEDTVTVTQTDGALRIDVDDNDYVSRMDGGIDADGSFDVGGLRTQLGGKITITARSRGTFTASNMTSEARARVAGSGLSCTIEAEVTGTKR